MDGTNDDAEKQRQNAINSVKDDIDFSTLKSRFSEEEVNSSGIKKHADVVLAVMDRMKDTAPLSYWLCYFCVLQEKGWIEENVNGFCNNMNKIFGIKLDVSSFNKIKNQYGSDLKKWPDLDKRLKEKKDFGLLFRAYLDFYLDYRMQRIKHDFQ